MSIRVISIVWDRYPEGGAKLLTMLALADWGNDRGGRIYPSMKTLAGKIRISERQTIRIIHDLVENDYLEHLNPENKGGRDTPNRYRIRLETLTICQSYVAVNPDISSVNPDISSINPDIAMSDEPLEPLEPLLMTGLVDKSEPGERQGPATWPKKQSRADTLRQYLKSIEAVPEQDEAISIEIKRAKKELDEITGANQGDMLIEAAADDA
ncbi:MAG: hypothetical protein IIB69_13875 [Proteobacteria bacterium]|nr:hypothetical protein [Pseudomonadota bacterium]